MTVTSNIHFGLSAWANQTYSVGARVSTGGNAYQCIVGGSSTSAPTGTGAIINNGGAAFWRWLSAVDYTTVQAWVNGWPSTLVDNLVGQLWNDAVYTTTAGTSYMSASGHTMGSFTATLVPAPGEGLRDRLRDNNFSLAYSTVNGVSFQLPAGTGNVNYFNVTDANVVIDGVQIQDPNSTSNSTIVGTNTGATGFVLRNSIIDGYPQAAGANMVAIGDGATLANVLIVDRQGSGGTNPVIADFGSNPIHYVNLTVVGVNNPTGAGALDSSCSSTGKIFRNCVTMGYGTGTGSVSSIANSAGTLTADHCVVSDTAADWTAFSVTDGGGNLFSKTAANQFVSATTDFRLKVGADCLNAGTTDTTDIPTGDDIRRVPRPQGTSWDVGAWELVGASPLPGPLVGRQQETDVRMRAQPAVFGPPLIPPVMQIAAVIRRIFTAQEQPRHPLPTLGSALPGRTIADPGPKSLFIVQQQPWHPTSLTRSGVDIQTGLSPTDPFGLEFSFEFGGGPSASNQVAPPPQIGAILGRQEQPSQQFAIVRTAIIGRNVMPPVTTSLSVRQETPASPPNLLSPSLSGATVRSSVSDKILVSQTQPPYLAAILGAGVQGPTVRPPVFDALILRQEIPASPPPVMRGGQVDQVAASGTILGIIGRQERPWHPLPRTDFRRPDQPPPPQYLTGSAVGVSQEQPPGSDVRHSLLQAGPQGPNTRPPVQDTVIVPQVQPPWMAPLLAHTLFGTNVRVPVLDTLLMRQELPSTANQAALLQPGRQGPDVRIPLTDTIVLRQEWPSHPLPRLDSGVWPRSVMAPVIQVVIQRQEWPWHPPPLLAHYLYGANVRPAVTDAVVLRQEWPWHPLSRFDSGVWPRSVAASQVPIIGRLDLPLQPLPLLVVGVQTTTFLPAVARVLIGRQESPFHPPPAVRSGGYTNRPFVRGRTVKLLV